MSQFSSSLVCPVLPSPSPPPLLAITCLRQLNGLVLPFDLVQLKDRLDMEQLGIEKWTRPSSGIGIRELDRPHPPLLSNTTCLEYSRQQGQG